MPVINFPSNPSNNELFIAEGKAMRYNSDKNKWRQVTTLTQSQVTSLENNTIGVASMSISGNTLVIEKDNGTHANVSLAPFAGNILTNYASASNLPLTGLVSGTQVYVEDTDSLFITDGSGWFKVATVNLSPSLSLGVASISLGPGGSVDVNYTVNEPEDTPYTISASATSNATVTVHQSNNTITFSTPVQDTSETITISATDGVNTVGDTLTMTIILPPPWSSATLNTRLDPNPGVFGQAGEQIFLAGDMLAVGAPTSVTTGSSGRDGGTAGRVHMYKRNSGSAPNWSKTTDIQSTNSGQYQNFGMGVSVTPDISSSAFSTSTPNWLVVGEPNLGSAGQNKGGNHPDTQMGRISIHRYTGSAWTHLTNVPNNTTGITGLFGWQVHYDASGERIFVGAPWTSSKRGKVYVYKGSGNDASRTFSLEAELTDSNGGSDDQFGYMVKSNQDGSILAVTSYYYDYNVARKGAVIVYTRSGTTWTQRATIQGSDTALYDNFGIGLDINDAGDTIVVGAPNNDTGSTDRGKVYVFTGSGDSWTQVFMGQPSDIGHDDQFGHDVAISGDSIIVGSRENSSTSSGNPVGAAYIFTNDGSNYGIVNMSSDNTSHLFDHFSTFVEPGQSFRNQSPTNIIFNNDGTKMYIISSSKTIVEYTLATAYDISSVTITHEIDSRTRIPVPKGFRFNSDGTKLHILSGFTGSAYGRMFVQYDLSTPYDLSTASWANNDYTIPTSIAGDSGSPGVDNNFDNFEFFNNGNGVIMPGQQNRKVFQFSLSTPYDLSTLSYDSKSILVSSNEEPKYALFNNDGTKLVTGGVQTDRIRTFTLSSAYDLSTASYDGDSGSFLTNDSIVPGSNINVNDIVFNSDGTKIYLTTSNGSSIHQYTTGIYKQQKKLFDSTLEDGARLGWSVDIDENTAAVGSRQANVGGQSGAGNVYVYEK